MCAQVTVANKGYEQLARSSALRVEENYLLSILGAFLNERPLEAPPQGMSIKALLSLAKRHKVAAIVGYMAASNPGVCDAQFLGLFVNELNYSVARETQQTAESHSVNDAFRRADIKYLPLKGYVMREYYPESYLRYCVDYDVLVEEEAVARAEEVLVQLGYQCDHWCEHHAAFHKRNLFSVELHFKLFNTFNLYTEVRKVEWASLIPYDETEYRFTREDFYRYMVEHLLKHWAGDDVKIRDVLDIGFYNRKFGSTLNRVKLDADLATGGSLQFAKNVERLADVCFNGASGDPLLDEMLLYIFHRHPLFVADSDCQADAPSAGGKESAVFKRRGRLLRRVWNKIFVPDRVVEFKMRSLGVPSWARIFYRVGLWLSFWRKRFFRLDFFSRLWAFLRSSNEPISDKRSAFHLRSGIDPSKLSARDWNKE